MLSWEELMELTADSVDPRPFNEVVRKYNDTWRTDEDLVVTIKTRNGRRLPTYLLRMEYKRRLEQRGL